MSWADELGIAQEQGRRALGDLDASRQAWLQAEQRLVEAQMAATVARLQFWLPEAGSPAE
jgi:hypothetical protein